jgi:alpha-glucosidase (family GH31 glycosyl hydrolase)
LGNRTRSCKKCGFFVSSPNSSTKDIGDRLFFDLRDIDKKESRRKLKIIDGEDKKMPGVVKGMSIQSIIKNYAEDHGRKPLGVC